MPGQISRPDDILAEAARHPRQAGSLQVESLSCLHGELRAAAVSQGQAVGALDVQRKQISNTQMCAPCKKRPFS